MSLGFLLGWRTQMMTHIGVSTEDYLSAINQKRRTVSDRDIKCFGEDIALFERL